ncbi:MAG: extracellular solute-binding protein [Phycisphaerales bacterium]|nr:extracellular solute-binding protein [Phycisphaerales bacterium]
MDLFHRFAIGCICSLVFFGGCSRNDSQQDQTVTLYTSVDDEFAQLVIDEFTSKTGISVDVLGDTEATKTTGLVTRIAAEIEHPIADVWWSSEPMGTILLDQSGALAPDAMRSLVAEDWPSTLHSKNWSWVGTAMRARVIGYANDRVLTPPTTLAQLTDPTYRGRIGMARPQFGTTRIHMAMLADRWGIDAFESWLRAIKENNIRLYDGNARVVAAIAMGEIDIGLTDTDDVWAGQRNGWNVDLVYESQTDHPTWDSTGATLIPNTVAIINDAPNRALAEQLATFLVSANTERMLYESSTHNTPVRQSLRETLSAMDLGDDLLSIDEIPDYYRASQKVREAMDACERVLISP